MLFRVQNSSVEYSYKGLMFNSINAIKKIFLNFFGGIPWMFLHQFQIILNFLYVCQSVSCLTFLLKLDKYRHISSSVWDIFLKFFGGIPGMFGHLFHIILNFLHVSQSVSWLIFILELDKYMDISSSWWNVLLIFFGDIPGMLVHFFHIILNFLHVCQSGNWLTFLLKFDKYMDISSSWWNIFLSWADPYIQP